MSKGDYNISPDEIPESGPPDFCAIGQHPYEIRVSDDGELERHCNDCGKTEPVADDECVDGRMNWHPEHDFHFGVCRRCDAEDGV